jgi:probable phosphoglycerate mutase
MNKKELQNNYFLVRHGHSKANKESVIVSNPEIGTVQYGLTENGKNQIRAAAADFSVKNDLVIYASDFLRTRESAVILEEELDVENVIYTPLLRERFFGYYDGLNDDQYDQVWEKDKNDENNKANSVESPRQVSNRVESLLREIESRHSNKNILLVSHGDCLQIMQTVFDDISPAKHRSLSHLNVAEIRKM